MAAPLFYHLTLGEGRGGVTRFHTGHRRYVFVTVNWVGLLYEKNKTQLDFLFLNVLEKNSAVQKREGWWIANQYHSSCLNIPFLIFFLCSLSQFVPSYSCSAFFCFVPLSTTSHALLHRGTYPAGSSASVWASHENSAGAADAANSAGWGVENFSLNKIQLHFSD